MAREAGERRLRHQLGKLLVLAGTNPKSWIPGVVVGSIGLALLDTLGVAAMAPLMQLITTGSADSGVLGSISDFSGPRRRRRSSPSSLASSPVFHPEERVRTPVPVVDPGTHDAHLGARIVATDEDVHPRSVRRIIGRDEQARSTAA